MASTHPNAPDQSLPVDPQASQTDESGEREEHSYGQILKSSAWIGGSSVLTIGVGIIRTKAMAVMLGPAGFGLMGLYSSIIDLALAVASMGIGNSGVRQIAESAGSNDEARIARTVIVLRRTAVILGILGAILVVMFAQPLSSLTFGTDRHAGAVALLGLAVFFRAVAAGQGALIQGLRRIHDLAVMGVLGALLGALISIILVYLWGEEGVAPSLVAGAAMGSLISWWYSRKVKIKYPLMTASEVKYEATSLLKLGFAFMVSGLLMMGAAYAVRTMVVRMEGYDAAGFYTAAWTLGGLYVGIILQAMGADFYPRLVAAGNDNPRCNRLVNEQTRVSLLLAGPGVTATIVLAPLVVSTFYSTEFLAAVDLLRWICLGIALRVINWPIGYIIVAKNKQAIFITTEIAWTVVNVTLTWLLLRRFGLSGAGMAFFGSYVIHGLAIYLIVRGLTDFRWSAENMRTLYLFLVTTAATFGGFYCLPLPLAYAIGAIVLLSSCAYSLRALIHLVPYYDFPAPFKRLLTHVRAK